MRIRERVGTQLGGLRRAIHASRTCWRLRVAVGCGGWITADGHETDYTTAPADIENHPHYLHQGADVYEVDGRYFQKHENRWVVYRERPRELQEPADETHR